MFTGDFQMAGRGTKDKEPLKARNAMAKKVEKDWEIQRRQQGKRTGRK